MTVHFYRESIEELVRRGGPSPSDYESFTELLSHIDAEYAEGDLTEKDLTVIRSAFGDALSLQTLQGLALHKRHGYAGDFEIIDKVYCGVVSPVRRLANWDRYLNVQASARALRNRKSYFQELLQELVERKGNGRPATVLNVASGPCRDVLEFMDRMPRAAVRIENVEHDGNAIRYAGALCAPYRDRIAFHHTNAFHFTTNEKYDLIWSAGLFDYLGDRDFRALLLRYAAFLEPDGELVIGNFARNHASRAYMEVVLDWRLHLRDPLTLMELSGSSGFGHDQTRLSAEPLGVNLFLHARREGEFLLDRPRCVTDGERELIYEGATPSVRCA